MAAMKQQGLGVLSISEHITGSPGFRDSCCVPPAVDPVFLFQFTLQFLENSQGMAISTPDSTL